jgi:hypothetical protein
MPAISRFFQIVQKGDEVCFMNDRIQVEVDEVLQIFFSNDGRRTKFVALKYSKIVIEEANGDRLFPKSKRDRLFQVIQALLKDTETDLEKLQEKMISLMTVQENIPLYSPQPNKANT